MRPIRLVVGFFAFLLVSCGGRETVTQSSVPPTATPTITILPVITPTIKATPVVSHSLGCEEWQSWPIIPVVSQTARDLYQRGQASGNNSHAFSKVGDG